MSYLHPLPKGHRYIVMLNGQQRKPVEQWDEEYVYCRLTTDPDGDHSYAVVVTDPGYSLPDLFVIELTTPGRPGSAHRWRIVDEQE